MDIIQIGILTLLKSAINEESYALPVDFCLEKALPVIRMHHMASLAYAGAIRCGLDRALPAMRQLKLMYSQYLVHSENQLQALRLLTNAFESAGVDYLLLKGSHMKVMYPLPELRAMGDADILIMDDQYPNIARIMQELGYSFVVRSDHDYVWDSKPLHVELHYRLLDPYNKVYADYFGNGWKLSKNLEGHRFVMASEDEFIYMLVHFAKHYRLGGIGCRHVVDLWVFLKNNPNLDMDYIDLWANRLDLGLFYLNVCNLIDAWFGDGMHNEATLPMTEYIFNSGSWGNINSIMKSQAVREKQLCKSSCKAERNIFLKLLFPPLKEIAYRYQILDKFPILLPIVWVWRWIDIVVSRPENIKIKLNAFSSILDDDISDVEMKFRKIGIYYTFEDK